MKRFISACLSLLLLVPAFCFSKEKSCKQCEKCSTCSVNNNKDRHRHNRRENRNSRHHNLRNKSMREEMAQDEEPDKDDGMPEYYQQED